MKTNIIIWAIAAGVIMLAGCKKMDPTAIPGVQITTEKQGLGTLDVQRGLGDLIGKVLPVSQYNLSLYNEERILDKFDVQQGNGYFVFSDVPAGVYTLSIYPVNPAIMPRLINGVVITPQEVTNLGILRMKYQ